MKIVKLNRRFRRYKEAGHTVALRFNDWMSASAIEKICKARLGSQYNRNSCWEGYFGYSKRIGPRPYWISFRNEADVTLVLLSADLTRNS